MGLTMLEGITPARAREIVAHPDTGEQVTILTVIRRAWPHNLDAIGEALDRAGVERQRLPFSALRRRTDSA